MHSQLLRSLALITLIFLQYRKDESFFEFANSFRVEDAAFMHLQNQGFQLVFHSALFLGFQFELRREPSSSFLVSVASVLDVFRYRLHQVPTVTEALPQNYGGRPNQSATRNQHKRRDP